MVLGEKFYDMHVVSASGGQIVNSLGMRVETERGDDVALDTLLIGAPPDVAKPSPEMVDFLQRALASTRRIASICVGAFILGEAGLLDGRRATTHWLFAKELQQRYPKTRVEVDRIYIADGQIWTSAGMTAGIDLALGLVERDLGPGKAREIARMMVIHHRRAGGQSQHSALLDIEARSDRVQAALQYARRNLSGNLSVERLSAVACLSPRQFSRVFRLETGASPRRRSGISVLKPRDCCWSKAACRSRRSLSTPASATEKGCGAVSCARMVKARNLFARWRTRSQRSDVSNVPVFAAAFASVIAVQ